MVKLYLKNEQNEFCQIFSNKEFGYYTLKVKHSKEDFEEDIDFKDMREFVPLSNEIDDYITKEILKYTPNAKVDLKAIKIGYSLNFLNTFTVQIHIGI